MRSLTAGVTCQTRCEGGMREEMSYKDTSVFKYELNGKNNDIFIDVYFPPIFEGPIEQYLNSDIISCSDTLHLKKRSNYI